MLMSHPAWVALAGFLPFCAGINIGRDDTTTPLYSATTWLVHDPTPLNETYQYRDSANDGWVAYTNPNGNDRGFENDNTVGWRLPDDDETAIILRVDTSNDNLASGIVWNCTEFCDEIITLLLDTGIDIYFPNTIASVNTTNTPGNDSAWYNTDTVPLKMHSTVYAFNSCDGDGIFYTITTIDGNGNELSYSGWNNVAAPVPAVYPVTAVVFANGVLGGWTENPGSANVTFYGIEPWSAAWSPESQKGDRPVPFAGLHARLIWCND